VLQLLILWDKNNYYRRFNLPFAVSILFKTLQVLIALVPHFILVYIFILYFVGRPHNEVMSSTEHSQTYQKDCALYWNVYIICNVLILYMINCVTTKNELIGMLVSLGSEVVEGSVLSGRIVQLPMNSVEWHQVNASCKFQIST
jgi:hypothetical protein